MALGLGQNKSRRASCTMSKVPIAASSYTIWATSKTTWRIQENIGLSSRMRLSLLIRCSNCSQTRPLSTTPLASIRETWSHVCWANVSSPLCHLQENLLGMKGIILQYIQGFRLSDMANHAPQSSWQQIFDQAIRIVHVLGDEQILNNDVRPDKFIVSATSNGGNQVHMIDFSICRQRRSDELYSEWGREKWWNDEEGAVGLVMKKRLRTCDFELHFIPSE